ncbi:nesprin-3 [Chanos chanos]|uniref:Nesprin-3 n=1 Tax=Chanos chanos TaxID=29144 RepID=A0A6J2VQ24_CHACN|nr:nesprin-3 [Chanos chanos]
MTQQEQHEFRESLESALSWMQAVQERLRDNDNTSGPRDALEARLRETEKIHESEHEGWMKVDVALAAAEVLLQNGDEEMKNQTHSKLKNLKALWEETSTYIIHCHSRIEWVWLHWSEYLKAHEEFILWLDKMQRLLEPEPEQQLGVREKMWQVDHHRVLFSDVQAQAPLLERLLDEAAALHNRTEDPSVDQQAQERMQEAYNNIRAKAEERLLLLEKIAEEHQQFQSCVHKFQTWLLSKTEEVNQLSEADNTVENKLKTWQELDASIANEEKTLQYIEGLAEAVKTNTSPAGAEQITQEVEDLRLAWERLRLTLEEVQKELQTSLDSQNQYSAHCQKLSEDIAQLRALVQGQSRELESKDGERTEEHTVALWRKYTGVRNTLLAEEPRVEQLKAQLKELFRFSHDSKNLSDDVLAAIKEYQSVKSKSFRLSSESEMDLKQFLQDPLHGFSQWSQLVSRVLEGSANVSEFTHIAELVQNIEKLLRHSLQLQERFSQLQVKSDLLTSVFGQEKAESLLEELNADVRKRELLHSQLLQRKSRLQGLISRTKDFGDAYDAVHKKLTHIKERFLSVDGLQPDILAKKSQADQLKVIKRDLEDCEAHITALETLVSSSSANRTKLECVYADWKQLYKAVRTKVNECEDGIEKHQNFHENLLNVEKWLMIMRQKLDSFRGTSGEWSVEDRQHEAERALGEFPAKELQLHQTEAEGQIVLARTSEEGRVHIVRDLRRLRESWMALHELSLNIFRLLNDRGSSGSLDLSACRSEDPLVPGQGVAQLEGGSSFRGKGSDSRDRTRDHESDLGSQQGCPWSYEGPEEEQREPSVRREVRGQTQGSGPDGQFHLGDEAQGRSELRTVTGMALDEDKMEIDKETNQRRGPSARWKAQRGGDSQTEVDAAPLRNIAFGMRGERKEGGGSYGARFVGGTESSGSGRTEEWVQGQMSIRGIDTEALQGGYGLMSDLNYATHEQRKTERSHETMLKGNVKTGTETLRSPSSQHTSAGTSTAQGLIDISQIESPVRQRHADYETRRREFEAWLRKEENKLSGILRNLKALSSKELKMRQNTLKGLRSNVACGQTQFQLLLESWDGDTGLEDVGLEELRYRWMLYKSKLKDIGDLKAQLRIKETSVQKEGHIQTRKQKGGGFLYRVCRVALPLQLLLLALLLLAFLLPMMDEGTSCSLTNNFARSFNIMLRYDGPPPT